MSEFLIESHRDTLQDIIRTLCNGDIAAEQIEKFNQECESISQQDLSTVFQQLNDENIDFQNNEAVIEFFDDIVEEKIARAKLNNYVTGHPVRTYLEENILLRRWIKQIWYHHPQKDMPGFIKIFQDISKVELHYQRKENQLFPCLEKHGWDGPSKNMWAMHDENRAIIKTLRLAIEAGDVEKVEQEVPQLLSELERMMQIEEQRLLPNAMELLDEDDWFDMREGDSEIGWMLEHEPAPFPAEESYPELETEQDPGTQCPFAAARKASEGIDEQVAEAQAAATEYVHPSQVKRKKRVPFDTTGMFHFDEGYMTPEQVNLIFKTLPLDLTYVDEHGKVLFYNRGQDRLFPRSAGIIGREVHHCHPPKSVGTVLKIVEEFKKGTRDVADFRINIKGSFILIRYFAVRDEDRNYRGVLEMSQDITNIQTLEGEQRLLDWD